MRPTHARLATLDEIPFIAERLKESGGIRIDLYRAPVWVAERNGQIVGILAAHLNWNIEPLLIFPEVKDKAVRRRACYGLYRAAEAWISDSNRNITGVSEAFAVTRSPVVMSWARRMGWFRQFKRASFFIKHFGGNTNGN
jgi:N-acetylglutamate synthase-like GNAT family acetyltransferase